MTDQHEYRRTGVLRAYSSPGEHPGPAIPAALIAQTRAPTYGSTPAWPASLIGPSERELTRWSELWRYPEAAGWAQTEQQTTVATLVRAEHRCQRRHPSPLAEFERGRLRDELGLDED